MTGPLGVEVENLSRRFKTKNRPDVVALDCVSLAIDEGEVHGLLGPNGAGKTTLIRILSTVLLPTSGRARVLGFDVVEDLKAVRKVIGIVFGGERGLYTRLTGRQNLLYWAAIYDVSPRRRPAVVEALLERVGLLDRADDRIETYSRGMRQRLRLARGLVGDPRVIFFDEPSSGMDPVAARDFRTMVGELAAEGRTILLATHDLVEAETVCGRVSLIAGGKILASGRPRELGLAEGDQRIECDDVSQSVLLRVQAHPAVTRTTGQRDGSTEITVSPDGLSDVLGLLVSSDVRSLRVTRPSLEDAYLTLMAEQSSDS